MPIRGHDAGRHRGSAEDRIGVAVSVQGKPRIIEYIDLPRGSPNGGYRTIAPLLGRNLALHVIDVSPAGDR